MRSRRLRGIFGAQIPQYFGFNWAFQCNSNKRVAQWTKIKNSTRETQYESNAAKKRRLTPRGRGSYRTLPQQTTGIYSIGATLTR
jgi:hypothetical protein